MKKVVAVIVACGLLFGTLTACSSSYKDGTYTGVYVVTEGRKTTGEASVTIKDGKIVEVTYVEKDENDKVKDENYAKGAGEEKYAMAQKAVEGAKSYPAILVKTQDLSKVDAVSGATTSLKMFKGAVEEALKQAK